MLLHISTSPDVCETSLKNHFCLIFVVFLFFLSVSASEKPDRVHAKDSQPYNRHHEGSQALVVQPDDFPFYHRLLQ
jgi:hypothetical protein